MVFSELARLAVDPLADLHRIQNEMSRILAGWDAPAGGEYPRTNLWMGNNSVVVTAELPGLGPEDVEVAVRDDTLTIQGTRERPAGGKDAIWHRRERDYGPFTRSIELPFRVDPDKVQARFFNGKLEVEMQRPESDRPRKIEIRAS